jgi:hypothetical protein
MKKADATLVSQTMGWPSKKIISPHVTHLTKIRPPVILSIAILAFVLFFALLLNVWIHTKIVDVGYRIGELTHQKKMLITQYRNLNIEHDRVLSGKNLQKMARRRFHLYPLTLKQTVHINEKD